MNSIDHLYLLVHPFDNMHDKDQKQQWENLWMESIDKAAAEPNSFGIYYFSGRSSNLDQPEDFKFHLCNPNEQELGLGKYLQESFGEDRSKIVVQANLYPFSICTYDEGIESRLVEKSKVQATVRGVYAERCVLDGCKAVTEAYGLTIDQTTLVGAESIFANAQTASLLGFPNNVLRTPW